MTEAPKTQKLQRFGRYLILDHLVDGGMAKICRARFLGEQADKIVAIKMIQPQYSQDANFRKMFMDEIKVAFSLIHPNIAQTYDYGVIKDQLYTAMEYCDGANLKQFLDRLRQKKFVFPVEISIHIISQVCLGLNYAHQFTDKLTGKQANIIHRDISPHNIMITYDGAVKIIDFGIAKAESNSESTKAGTIKGKLSYLAPEYLDGLELDHRYDQFAVGITLWELLCCRKLFQANNELAVLKLIQACKVPPPSSINPNVPKELDQIVMKALSKDRSQRFKDMDQFNRALVKCLYSQYPDFNASDLSAFAKELFKEEIKIDRAKLIEYGKINIAPYLEDLKKETTGGGSPTSKSTKFEDEKDSGTKTGVLLREEARKELDLGFNPAEKTRSVGGLELNLPRPAGANGKRPAKPQDIQMPGPQTARPASPGITVVGSERPARAANSHATPTTSRPHLERTGKIQVNTAVTKKQGMSSYMLLGLLALAVFGYFKKEMLVDLVTSHVLGEKDRAPASTGKNVDNVKESMKKTGYVKVSGLDSLMEIFLNNRKVDYTSLGIRVPIGEEQIVTIRKRGFKDYSAQVNLTEESSTYILQVPELEKVSEGLLYTTNNYKPGTTIKLEVEGKVVEQDLPISSWRLPAGTYEAVIKNEFYGIEKKITVEIQENQRTLLPY